MPQRKTPVETQQWLIGAHKAITAATAIALCEPGSDEEAEMYAQFDYLAMTVKADGESGYLGFTYAVEAMTWHAYSASGRPGTTHPHHHPESKVRELLSQAFAAPTLHDFIKTVCYPDDRQPVGIDYMLRACVEALRSELDCWDGDMQKWGYLGTLSALVTRGA